MDYLEIISGFRAIFESLFFSLLILAIFYQLFRNSYKAAIATSVSLLFIYLYTTIYFLIQSLGIKTNPLGSHYIFLPLWGVLFFLSIWIVGWKIKSSEMINGFLNIFSIALIGILVFQFIIGQQKNSSFSSDSLNVKSIDNQLKPPEDSRQPDVYYIVLDGYSSNQVLKSEYGFDNDKFIKELRKRGFYIADCSHSNYPSTAYSMASSLNLNYIPPVGLQLMKGNHNWEDFKPFIRFNTVRSTFKTLGYKIVSFDTYLPWPNTPNSDIFISPRGMSNLTLSKFTSSFLGEINEYEKLLIDTTPLFLQNKLFRITRFEDSYKFLSTRLKSLLKWDTNVQFEHRQMYEYYKYDFEQLASTPQIPGKKFVYAHFMSTHRPFLFDKNGEFANDQSKEGYIESIQYTNTEILKSIDQIITNSHPKPIIVLQGDHSLPGSQDAYGILNAYFLPDGGESRLYTTISPVNSFRIIFNEYFGGDLPLLPDNSFWMYEYRRKIIPELQNIKCE